ncbi:hypothetical protein ACHAW6_014255 [Cyclotella cf. meneghiniana]
MMLSSVTLSTSLLLHCCPTAALTAPNHHRSSLLAIPSQQRRPLHASLHPNNHDDYADFPENNTEQIIPLSQIFRRALVLQRSGVDRSGALQAYQHFLQVATLHDVDPSLYAEVYANMGAVYAMQGRDDGDVEMRRELRRKAKSCFQSAVEYRPGLGSAWVNLALLMLAEGKEMGGEDVSKVGDVLQEARSCCVRALGMDNDDERSRALANKLVGDIDGMMKQTRT